MRDIADYTTKYCNEPFEYKMVEIRKKMILKQCSKYPHASILEIGCGLEPFFLECHDFQQMVIVDSSKIFADNARKLVQQQGVPVLVVDGFLENKVEEIQKTGIKFDFVLLSGVLQEVEEPHKMLHAIRELCNEDTILHVNVPNAKSFHRLLAVEMGLIQDPHQKSDMNILLQQRCVYDMDLLRSEIARAGFVILDSGSYFIKPFTHAQMQRCLAEGIFDQRLLEGLEGMIKYFPEYGGEIFINCRVGDRQDITMAY